jgi:predicted DNA-binding transcriptional regulator YafY
MPSNDKLVRWFDLLAALLQRRFPVTFTELARDVPAYAHTDKPSATLLRMFERDKDELRHAGIRIDTVESTEGEPSSYQLKSEHFYLPYLVLAGAESPLTSADTASTTSSTTSATSASPAQAARLIPRTGVGARRLPTLSVLPEEAVMLRRAAARVRSLGEPQLTTDADQALRKLRHDLPDTILVPDTPDAKHARSDFATLADAVHRRKRLTFEYHSMGRGEQDRRTVEPYGMVYLTGNWYPRRTRRRSARSGIARHTHAPPVPHLAHVTREGEHRTTQHPGL